MNKNVTVIQASGNNHYPFHLYAVRGLSHWNLEPLDSFEYYLKGKKSMFTIIGRIRPKLNVGPVKQFVTDPFDNDPNRIYEKLVEHMELLKIYAFYIKWKIVDSLMFCYE